MCPPSDPQQHHFSFPRLPQPKTALGLCHLGVPHPQWQRASLPFLMSPSALSSPSLGLFSFSLLHQLHLRTLAASGCPGDIPLGPSTSLACLACFLLEDLLPACPWREVVRLMTKGWDQGGEMQWLFRTPWRDVFVQGISNIFAGNSNIDFSPTNHSAFAQSHQSVEPFSFCKWARCLTHDLRAWTLRLIFFYFHLQAWIFAPFCRWLGALLFTKICLG